MCDKPELKHPEKIWHQLNSFQFIVAVIIHRGHAAKCAAGQLNSPLRCLMFGRFVADSSHARSYGLPPAAYARSEPMSDWLHAMLYNPYYTVRSPATWLLSVCKWNMTDWLKTVRFCRNLSFSRTVELSYRVSTRIFSPVKQTSLGNCGDFWYSTWR